MSEFVSSILELCFDITNIREYPYNKVTDNKCFSAKCNAYVESGNFGFKFTKNMYALTCLDDIFLLKHQHAGRKPL